MSGFIVQNTLSGKDMAAVIFGELGLFATEGLLKYFTTDELKKLSRHMKNLSGWYDVNAENSVLEEFVRFGITKKWVPSDTLNRISENAARAAEVRDPVMERFRENKDAVAKALSMWLKED